MDVNTVVKPTSCVETPAVELAPAGGPTAVERAREVGAAAVELAREAEQTLNGFRNAYASFGKPRALPNGLGLAVGLCYLPGVLTLFDNSNKLQPAEITRAGPGDDDGPSQGPLEAFRAYRRLNRRYNLIFRPSARPGIFTRCVRKLAYKVLRTETARSLAISKTSLPGRPDFRRRFQDSLYMNDVRGANDHSHPKAAALRSEATRALRRAVVDAGWVPYEISPSLGSQERGCRLYFAPRDLPAALRVDALSPLSCYIMTDVDYYVDLPALLSTDRPLAFYTFYPHKLCGTSLDASWHFEGDDVVMKVCGGATYRHGLWNLDADYIHTVDSYGTAHFYAVESRVMRNDPNRRIVWMAPVCAVPGPYWKSAQQGSVLLQRRRIQYPGYQLMAYLNGDEPMISAGVDGIDGSIEMSSLALSSARIRSTESKTFSISTCSRLINKAGYPNDVCDVYAPILYVLLTRMDSLALPGTSPTSEVKDKPKYANRSSTYYVGGGADFQDGKPTFYPHGAPIIHNPAVGPLNCFDSELLAVKGRVTRLVNKAIPPVCFDIYCEDFVNELVKNISVVKIDYEGVIDRCTRSMQRGRLSNNVDLVDYALEQAYDAFVKAEAYPKASEPRLISNMPVSHNFKLAGYTLPLADAIKSRFAWYASGKTTNEIERRLLDIALQGHKLVATDYSRFDGRISEWLETRITQATLRRCFPDDKELDELIRYEDGAVGRTMGGVRVPAGFHRKSGSALTSIGNTLINAFVSYCSYRKDKHNHATAMGLLGVYLGDDGLCPESQHLSSVAKQLGLVLECEQISHNSMGCTVLPFVGRIFIPLDMDTITSFQAPIRTLGKLHGTVRPDPESLVEKAIGYLTTDSQTGPVAYYCHAVLRAFGRGYDTSIVQDPDLKRKLDMPWYQSPRTTELFLEYSGLDAIDYDAFVVACLSVRACHPEDLYGIVPLPLYGPAPTLEHANEDFAFDNHVSKPTSQDDISPNISDKPCQERRTTRSRARRRKSPSSDNSSPN
nr:RNA-dependent RNA polymerase [Mute swan feces associated noda-like virus 5]